MPSIALLNCHNISGVSGFPKLRQSTTAYGVAPIDITFLIASATHPAAPSNGDNLVWIVFESVVSAIAVFSSILKTAASSPGFTTVLT